MKSEYADQQRGIASEVVGIASGYVEPLCLLSDVVAKLDVLTSFAQVCSDAPEPYVRPRLLAKGLLQLGYKMGRRTSPAMPSVL